MKSCSFWEERLLGAGGRGNPVFLALLNWEGGKEGVGLIHLPDTYFSYWIFIDFLHLLFVFNTLSRNFICFFKNNFHQFLWGSKLQEFPMLPCQDLISPCLYVFKDSFAGYRILGFHNPHPHTLNMLSHCLLPSIISFF